MKMTVEMDMDNAAFGGYPEGEASRILREAAERVYQGDGVVILRDVNGNIVGKLEITDVDGEMG